LTGELFDDASHPGDSRDIIYRLGMPGLMIGLAGVMHGLLRNVRPECVPSILAFEPPLMH
jgi:lantibiotic modifying enzyme